MDSLPREQKFYYSGRARLVLVEVKVENVERVLSLLDSTVHVTKLRIKAGLWDQKNKIVIVTETMIGVDTVWNHSMARLHPHTMVLLRKPRSWQVFPPLSSNKEPMKILEKDLTSELLHSVFMERSSDGLAGRHFRVGTNPYSHHVNYKATTEGEETTYHDLWGYEVIMLEILRSKLQFTYSIHPPEDGEWGAVKEDGSLSGLVGQVSKGEVDFIMSGVMATGDRMNVADSPVFFDYDHMVFVSPPPSPQPKIDALIRPFTPRMWVFVVTSVLCFPIYLLIIFTISNKIHSSEDTEWTSLGNCTWFTFATFIGESVMRYEGKIDITPLRIVIGSWYFYALIITASYAGEIRSFFIKPSESPAIGESHFTLVAGNVFLDTLEGVLASELPWGMALYGEEEETVMAASQDPIIKALWEGKQVFELDENYAVLDAVARGEQVYIDYRNGIIPQIEVRFQLEGGKTGIHLASHRWTKFSWIGWFFNKFFPYTEQFKHNMFRALEGGLLEDGRRKTWARMKEEYLKAQSSTTAPGKGPSSVVTPLSMDDLQGNFYLLFLGTIISCLVHLGLYIYKMVEFRRHPERFNGSCRSNCRESIE